MEARGLGAGSTADRLAIAAEQTAKNTKRLVEEARMGGLTFECRKFIKRGGYESGHWRQLRNRELAVIA